MSDVERTRALVEMLRARYASRAVGERRDKDLGARVALLTEVPPETGSARGYADAVAVHLWRSDRYAIEGFELKASLADLRRELADPRKWRRVGDLCSRWWVVVWEAAWLGKVTVPPEWGVLARAETVNGPALRVVRKAPPLHGGRVATAHVRSPLPAGFVAALVRRATETSPAAKHLAAVAVDAYERGVRHGELEGQEEEARRWGALVEAWRAAHPEERWRRADPEAVVAWALATIKPGGET